MPLDRPANINAEDTVATLSSTRLTLAMSRSSVAFNGQDIIAAVQSNAPALPDGSVRQWFIRLYLTGNAKEQFPEGYYDVALWRITSPASWNDKQTGANTALAAIRAIIRSTPSGGGGGGQVDTIVPGAAIDVDATDPVNPIVDVRVDGVTIGINGLNQLEVPAGGGGYVPVSRTISTTPPLAGGGNLSANRTIAIPQANGSTNGYLSSGDWTTFNNKGNVTGPVSSGADDIAIYDGTTGKVIKDSGVRLDQLLEESGFGDVGLIESATGNVPFILKDVKDGEATSVQSNTGSYQTNVRTQNSIVRDIGTNRIHLSGDASAPGNSKYYGTNGSGTKGFHDLPADTGITQLTGDVTAGPGNGSQAATLANTAVTPGSYGSATQSVALTVDSKGRLTAASQNTITPAVGSITGLGTGVASALAQNANSANGFVTQSSGDSRYLLASNELIGVLSSTQSTTSTSLVDCTGLSVSLSANSTYQIEAFILFQSTSNSNGISISLNGPASPTEFAAQINTSRIANNNVVCSMNGYNQTQNSLDVIAANKTQHAFINGTIVNGANSGDLIVRFASEAGTQTVRIMAGSSLRLRKIA